MEYLDQGISGAKASRPGWSECRDAIQKRRVKVLVVHALDRIGRSRPLSVHGWVYDIRDGLLRDLETCAAEPGEVEAIRC